MLIIRFDAIPGELGLCSLQEPGSLRFRADCFFRTEVADLPAVTVFFPTPGYPGVNQAAAVFTGGVLF